MADRAKQGALLTRVEAERREQMMETARRNGLVDGLAGRANQYGFVSKIQTDRVKAATELLEAETRCMEMYHGHQLAQQRLLSVHDQAQRHQEIERLQEENLIIQLQNEQSQLRQAGAETGRITGRDFQEEVDKAAQKTKLDAAKRVAQAEARVQARQEVRRKREAMKAAFLQETGGVMTPELELELKNIDDQFQQYLDEL